MTVVVNTSNANGKTVSVMEGSTSKANGVVASDHASILFNASSDVVYTIAWSENGAITTTSYRFTVAANASQGGGGNQSGDDN